MTQTHLILIDTVLAMTVYYLNHVINKHFPSENLIIFTLKYFFKKVKQKVTVSHSVMSDSLQPHGL